MTILGGPIFGSATVDSQTGKIHFNPAADFTGVDLLWYQISDETGLSDIGLVVMTVTAVNDAPRANDDQEDTLKNEPTIVYVLGNDLDVDSAIDLLSLRIESAPGHGSVVTMADGTLQYTPRPDFVGSDQFEYSVADVPGDRSNTALVSIEVRAEPQLLVAGQTFEDIDQGGPGTDGPGLAGYPIYLLDGHGQLVASATTQNDDTATPEDETGWYLFSELAPGTYVVAQKEVPGWLQSHPEDDGIRLPELDVNPGLYVVTMSRANEMEILDFGNYRSGETGTARISGFVYADVDDDGVYDAQEMGLPNVPITIEGPVTRAVITGPDGRYRADDLPPGVYSITETQPMTFQDGKDSPGTPRSGVVADDRFDNVELLPYMTAENYNFGECGLKVEFISKAMLLSSTPVTPAYGAGSDVADGESLLKLESAATGVLRVSALGDGESSAIQLYDTEWRPVELRGQGGVVHVPVDEGDQFVVYISTDSDTHVSATLTQLSEAQPVLVHTNTAWPADVSGDHFLSPIDALLVIQHLNQRGARSVKGVNLSPSYPDVNGDGYLSPYDALLVIQTLNLRETGRSDGEGEGEPASDIGTEITSSAAPHLLIDHVLSEHDLGTAPSLERDWGEPAQRIMLSVNMPIGPTSVAMNQQALEAYLRETDDFDELDELVSLEDALELIGAWYQGPGQ